MFVGIRMPLLNWTNEIAPIKLSGAVAIILYGGWGVIVIMAGLYLLIGYRIGAVCYLACWSILLAIVSIVLFKWLDTGGAEVGPSQGAEDSAHHRHRQAAHRRDGDEGRRACHRA